MTPERKAELRAEIETFLGPAPESKPSVAIKPKMEVVASEGRVIRDANVVVSRADPNARPSSDVVQVRRPEQVTINMAEVERQYWMREQDRAIDRIRRGQLDPFGYGHWGRFDD